MRLLPINGEKEDSQLLSVLPMLNKIARPASAPLSLSQLKEWLVGNTLAAENFYGALSSQYQVDFLIYDAEGQHAHNYRHQSYGLIRIAYYDGAYWPAELQPVNTPQANLRFDGIKFLFIGYNPDEKIKAAIFAKGGKSNELCSYC